MKPIMFAGTLDGANRRKDKSVTARATSNYEMTTEGFAEIDRLVGTTGYFLFSPNEIQPDQIPDVPADQALGRMTPSQELRWSLKKLYEQDGPDMEWPDFYRYQMNQFIAGVRGKLE